jgi:LmbE family N-acetylglucosaminyl deacetylase
MKLSRDTAEVFVPDGTPPDEALARTDEMAIGAHPDDLEITAASAILGCFRQREKRFCGVVVTNGAGSPREGAFADYTDEQMQQVRRQEQKKAAALGEYGAVVLLDHPSAAVKDAANKAPVEDLRAVLSAAAPRVVYTHNPADKHDTHVAVTLRVIEAIRGLPAAARPGRLLGCEGWRDLDWLTDVLRLARDGRGDGLDVRHGSDPADCGPGQGRRAVHASTDRAVFAGRRRTSAPAPLGAAMKERGLPGAKGTLRSCSPDRLPRTS